MAAMNDLLRLAVIAVGALNLALGLAFLVRPEWMAAQFYLTPIGSQGLATIRADFPAFFLTAAAGALWGAWRRLPDLLLVPVLLLGIALVGRTVSLVADGVGPTALPPMIAEAVMIAVLLAARKAFARTA
jgi:hypothetical protein